MLSDLILAARARKHGARHALGIVRAAHRAHISPSLGLALVQQESGFQNIFGHDPGNHSGAGKVTRKKYLDYKAKRGPRGYGGMQGVGLTQLTWWEFQDEADRRGGAWKPKPQLNVAFEHLNMLIRQKGLRGGIAAYNGTGPAATAYSDHVRGLANHWHAVLLGKA